MLAGTTAHAVPANACHEQLTGEDLQQVRTGNRPNACAATRNLVTGAFRHAGDTNIAHARRWHAHDDQRIPHA